MTLIKVWFDYWTCSGCWKIFYSKAEFSAHRNTCEGNGHVDR